MVTCHQTSQHKTNHKTHANQLNSDKFCSLPVPSIYIVIQTIPSLIFLKNRAHCLHTPTMQNFTGISRNIQSKSYMLSLTECAWGDRNDDSCTHPWTIDDCDCCGILFNISYCCLPFQPMGHWPMGVTRIAMYVKALLYRIFSTTAACAPFFTECLRNAAKEKQNINPAYICILPAFVINTLFH